MVTALIVLGSVILLVLVSRYREIPKHQRTLNPRKMLRRARFSEQCSYRPDETAKRFAEQWSKHPTLSQRQANAIKRSLRKRDRG